MIYKLVGCVVLLLAGGYVSASFTRFEHRRLRVLDGYIALIHYIKGQIDCYAMPLSDIFARVDPTVIAACLGLPPDTPVPVSSHMGEHSLPNMVRESRLYLEPESERLLKAFTGELGTTYRAQQVARCEHYLEALTEERKRLHDTLPARLRTGSILCLCCALGAAVLLW
jgi:hypothetical protein